MSWPIGAAVGNALEMVEAWQVLRGAKVAGTRALTLALAAEMVRLAGAASNAADALQGVTRALDDGSAAGKFLAMVRAQGGDPSLLEEGMPLHPAPVVVDLLAPRDGVLAACDCFALGGLVVSLGGGRIAKEDSVDPRVGLVLLRDRGARVERGEAFARLHLAHADDAAVQRALACFTVGDTAPAALPADLVLERV
jgi:thymidine phosphorylase